MLMSSNIMMAISKSILIHLTQCKVNTEISSGKTVNQNMNIMKVQYSCGLIMLVKSLIEKLK